MKKIIIISLLIVVLMPLAALAQATTEIKYHSYKSYAHDASDIKWAAGQSIREYLNTFDLDSIENALLDAVADIAAIVIDLDSAEAVLTSHVNNTSNPHSVTATQINVDTTTEVSDSGTVLGQLVDIGMSIYQQKFSGFISWGGTGNYWEITDGKFVLLRAGMGYIYGRKVNFTAPQTSEVLVANTEYYVYIDRNGIIQLTSTKETAFDAIPIVEVLYDGTNYTVVKENHLYTFPTRVSSYVHNNIGTIIRNAAGGANIDKLGTTTGADVNDRRIELLGADVLEDHGLETTIPDSTGAAITINYYYTDAAGKWIRYDQTTEVPMVWNNAGTVTALTANRYGNFRLYVSKDNLNDTTPVYFAVIGAYDHTTAVAAANRITAGMAAATNELAGLELAQLGYVTVHNSTGGYISTVIVEKATLRGETTGSGATNIAALISTTAFTGTLTGALNVQAALNIIDAWTVLTDMDSAENAIELILADNDSQDVQIEANRVALTSTATKAEVSEEVLVHNESATAHAGILTTLAQTSQEVAVHNEATSAHSTLFANYAARYWYPLNMIDGDYTGEIIIDSIEASMTAYTAVYYGSSGFANAKGDADATLPAIGLILETGTGNKKVLLKGIVRNDTWDWAKGATIYVSTSSAGALTSTRPSTTGNRVNVIGYALSSDEVLIAPTGIYVEI